MLTVLMAALYLARRGHAASHALVALATAMKVLPVFYLANLGRMRREDRIGWGLVSFSLLLALKMNVARHLLVVLLGPDKPYYRT
ncbi:MAG TPA: hypothetical protein VFU28_21360 [Vicinamibacterales bacterium]|nr:hypothetical protein [Vicinamibacterales bacterium]